MSAQSGLSLMTEEKFDFEHLYRSHAEKILNLAFRMTGREDVAKDLTQDVFLKLYERHQDFRGDSQIYTWIYRIAVNHILNYLKKEKRMRWFDLLDKNVADLFQKRSYDSEWSLNNRPATPLEQLVSCAKPSSGSQNKSTKVMYLMRGVFINIYFLCLL